MFVYRLAQGTESVFNYPIKWVFYFSIFEFRMKEPLCAKYMYEIIIPELCLPRVKKLKTEENKTTSSQIVRFQSIFHM